MLSGSILISAFLKLCYIGGFVLFLIAVNGLKDNALSREDKSALYLLFGASIVAVVSALCDIFPMFFLNAISSLLGLAQVILSIIAYSKLHKSTELATLNGMVTNGFRMLFSATFVLLVGAVIDLIPIVGGYIAIIPNVVGWVLILLGWKKASAPINVR